MTDPERANMLSTVRTTTALAESIALRGLAACEAMVAAVRELKAGRPDQAREILEAALAGERHDLH